LKNSLSNFVRAQSMKTAIVDAFEMLQTGKFDDAVNSITAAANKGVDLLSAGHDYYGEFQQRLDERDLADDDRRLPTGIVEVDEILGGGLKNKQFGLVVGSTGTGKTVLLSWLAKIAAQFYNKTVFYFTLELPERDISERFDSMVTRTKPRDLKNERAGVEAELSALAPKYKNKLYIKEFIPGSTPVSAFVTYYKNMAAQGIVADLVIIDYLDLIKAHTKYNNLNQDMDAICIALCGFAKDCDTRIWSATQMNRSGMVSDNPNEANIAGAIDKLFSVDVAVFMAQSKEEREYQEMRLSFIKNRNGPAGKSVKLETDYGYMTFYKKSIAKDEQRNDEDSSTSDEEGDQAVQLLRTDA
jgi:replicative DNA helicase